MSYCTNFTPQKKGKFTAELRRSGNISEAARLIGFSRRRAYQIRGEDAEFAEEWDHALQGYAEQVLEVEADRRAVEGVHWKTYYDKDGNEIGEERRYSDTLLIFRLKGLKPKMYKERLEVGGDQENPIQIAQRMEPEQRKTRIDALITKRMGGYEVEADVTHGD